MWISKKRKKPKNISSSKKSEGKNKVGKNISVSSWNNPEIKQYIGAKEDTVLSTEHVRYTKLKKKENEQEKKKEKFSFFKRKTKAVEKNIEKISYIELDTGTIEIGYDRKTNEVVLTFMYDTKREEVNATKAKNENEKAKEESQIEHSNFEPNKKVITVYGNISSGSSVKKSGIVTVRCGTNNILESIRKELYAGKKVNDKSSATKPLRQDNLYLIEKILPFADTSYEEKRRKEISQEKSKSKTDRSSMHTAMSVLKNVEAAKKYKEMQLSKCMQNASKVAKKYKSGRTNVSGYYLEILKKEKQKEESITSGEVATVSAVSSVEGIAAALKSEGKQKTSIFDKFGKTDKDTDSIKDNEIIETEKENYFNENIDNEEQENRITDKENSEVEDIDEYEEDIDSEDDGNGYEEDEDNEDDEENENENENETEDNEYEEDIDSENDENEYEENEYEEDEDNEDDEENENENETEDYEYEKEIDEAYDEESEDENNEDNEKIDQEDEELEVDNGQEDLRTNQASKSVDTVNNNANKSRKNSTKIKNEKKTVDESKLFTETDNEDSEMLEDEDQNSTQDGEKTNENENKLEGE